MDNIDIFSRHLPTFLLILLRASIFVSLMPFIGSKSFPAHFKIGFAVAIAFILTPVVEIDTANISIAVLVVREIIFGMVMGSAVRIIFLAVETAGQAVSNAMGLSIATVFNPELGQSTEVARFYAIVAMLILLSIDAHHDLISIFFISYEWIPVGQVDTMNLIVKVAAEGSRIFLFALKVAAPVIVGIMTASLLLGFIYKAAPQINIFFISFPVYILLGFMIMLLGIPVFANVLTGHFHSVREEMIRILSIARG